MIGVLKFLSTINQIQDFRQDIFRTEGDGWLVDTCRAADTGKWETGIFQNGLDGDCTIVEQYENRDEAQTGHEKWVETMKKNPRQTLPYLNVWEMEE